MFPHLPGNFLKWWFLFIPIFPPSLSFLPFPLVFGPLESMDTKVISTGVRYTSLPDSYVRPEADRPKLSEVRDCEDVPIIDLGSEDRTSIVQQIGNACLLYGFFQFIYLSTLEFYWVFIDVPICGSFQVINHGVSMEAAERMQEVAHEFFRLPVEEKMKLYSDDPSKTMRLSTSFNVKKETVHNWRDYLRLHCYPLDQYVPEWPSNPSSFK
ncbi:hypothetical protein RHMOL_Rhmol03G0238300 [Rhododendron molle]|uniref:Uncharacterized protein n=1 Tax=Rhododendron molle TaxID=49168 RepID=A0ACC0PJ71_RHOML|nr:hypothetical protein RHMOL_Rhmol03G0238300 [Rhododendron molle]